MNLSKLQKWITEFFGEEYKAEYNGGFLKIKNKDYTSGCIQLDHFDSPYHLKKEITKNIIQDKSNNIRKTFQNKLKTEREQELLNQF